MNTTASAMALRVDIVSDVVCPWCIIGYRQLQDALSRCPGQFETTLHWHPFELNPGMPPEGQDVREHIAQKYGSTRAQSDAARARLQALGDALGFRFDWHEGMRIVNTFAAHQLLAWAGERGRQTPLKLALFEGYFSQREDVSRPEVLARIASRAGLPEEDAAEVLRDGRYAQQVRAEQQVWRDREIHAVPAFVFNSRLLVSGAQEAATFVRVLQKLREMETAMPAAGQPSTRETG